MKKIAILSLDNIDIQNDSRVLRQIKYLGKDFIVDVITFGNGNIPIDLPVRSIHYVGSLSHSRILKKFRTVFLLTLGKLFPKFAYEKWYWGREGHQECLKILKNLNSSYIHANEWWTLPIAVEYANLCGAKIVLDLHEYAFDEYKDRKLFEFIYPDVVKYFFKKYIPFVNESVTINSMIAERYHKELGLDPIIIMNVPEILEEMPFKPIGKTIRLIHHGASMPERKLESMIETMPLLDKRFSLTMMLFGNPGYISELKAYAEKKAPGRVDFIPSVSPDKVISTVCNFDIGFCLIPNYNFNFEACLPNKFFEYIASGLAVCIGPSPAMASILNQYKFGIIGSSFDPQDIANALNRLTSDQINDMKMNSIYAHKFLNADVEQSKLINMYQNLSESRNATI